VAVTGEDDCGAALIPRTGIRSLHVRRLRPGAGTAVVDVDRAGAGGTIPRGRFVDAAGCHTGEAPVLTRRPDRERVALGGEGYFGGEDITRLGVRGLDVGLLRPGAHAAREDVSGAGKRIGHD